MRNEGHSRKTEQKSPTWNWVKSCFSWSSRFWRSGCSALLLGSSTDSTDPACSRNFFTAAKASRNRLTWDKSSCSPWMCCDSSCRKARSRCSRADCRDVSNTMVEVPMFLVRSSLRRYRWDSWDWISSNSCWRACQVRNKAYRYSWLRKSEGWGGGGGGGSCYFLWC